jgi:hypothetical protein
MHVNVRLSRAPVGGSISHESISAPNLSDFRWRLLYSHKPNVIENRRTVIIFDYTNGDVVHLVHTEIGTKERGTLVGRTEPGRADIYHDCNVIHDNFHELT